MKTLYTRPDFHWEMSLHHNNRQAAVQAGQQSTFRLMGVQMALVIIVSLFWGGLNNEAAISSLLGGLVSILPNAYFARRFFASGQDKDPKKIVHALYLGQLLKFLMTAGLSVLIFTQLSVAIVPFLTGFVAATLGLWFAPVLSLLPRKRGATTS